MNHRRYIELAKHISNWSKDPSKKIGAVAVGEDGEIIAQGYNGFPRDVLDLSERWGNRKTKHKFVVHAEMNMIFNSSLYGASLKNSIVYVYGLPVCSECAKGLIQVGVKRIYYYVGVEKISDKWKNSLEISKEMFSEVGISMVELKYHDLD